MSDPQVVLVDDEETLLLSLVKGLRAAGLKAQLHAATSIGQGLELIATRMPEVVVTDLSIEPSRGPESGFELIQKARAICPSTRCVVLTGHGASAFGIRAIEAGAANFLQKPPDLNHLKALIEDGIVQSRLRSERDALLRVASLDGASRLVGESVVMQELRKQIAFAAKTEQSVLLLGETGVGKGLCAQEIHRLSSRSKKSFVQYQPSFGAQDLVQSDLFGHERGAFTGALTERRGLIREAEGGTLFLDEIDALPPETQVLLLRALQEKKIRRVGSDREQIVDFRLIAASNARLDELVAQGKFRQDLFHRIAHFTIVIPALRDRTEDIPVLVRAIVERLVEEERISDVEFEIAALDKLRRYPWPGNIRELEAVVEHAALRAQFSNRAVVSVQEVVLRSDPPQSQSADSFAEMVEEYKLKLIKDALAKTQGNQSRAAELLKLDRSSLRRILERGERK